MALQHYRWQHNSYIIYMHYVWNLFMNIVCYEWQLFLSLRKNINTPWHKFRNVLRKSIQNKLCPLGKFITFQIVFQIPGCFLGVGINVLADSYNHFSFAQCCCQRSNSVIKKKTCTTLFTQPL